MASFVSEAGLELLASALKHVVDSALYSGEGPTFGGHKPRAKGLLPVSPVSTSPVSPLQGRAAADMSPSALELQVLK